MTNAVESAYALYVDDIKRITSAFSRRFQFADQEEVTSAANLIFVERVVSGHSAPAVLRGMARDLLDHFRGQMHKKSVVTVDFDAIPHPSAEVDSRFDGISHDARTLLQTVLDSPAAFWSALMPTRQRMTAKSIRRLICQQMTERHAWDVSRLERAWDEVKSELVAC